MVSHSMVSQGPALFVLGGGSLLLRGRRVLDDLAALSGVSGLWWRHVGGTEPKGGVALPHGRLAEALEQAALQAQEQRGQASESKGDLDGKRRSPRHTASGAALPPPATLELQPEEWRGLGIVGLRSEHFVKVAGAWFQSLTLTTDPWPRRDLGPNLRPHPSPNHNFHPYPHPRPRSRPTLPLSRAQVGEAYFQPAAAKLAREGDLMLACIDHPFTSGENPVATWLETERVGGTSLSDLHRSSQPPEAQARWRLALF